MLNPDEIYATITAAGEDWADKKAAYEALDDNSKSVLAEIKGRYLDAGETQGAAETRSLSSRDYVEHLAALSKARREFLRAQVRYDSLKMLSELRRSEESTRRAEMNLR